MVGWSQYLFSTINSLASIAIVVSLIFLVKRTKLLREQNQVGNDTARAENNARLREVMIKINEAFLQKPEIRRYFYEGASIDMNNPDYAYVETMAEHLLDIMEHMLWQADTFPNLYGSSEDAQLFWDVWDRYTVDMFVSSPFLRMYAQRRCTWYTYHIIDRLKRAQSVLSEKNNASEQSICS